jgi:aminopeptidase
MSLLQRSGNLGPPQLNRPVAPWAVVAVPGQQWAEHLFGQESSEKELWESFARILGLDSPQYRQSWQEHFSLIKHRLSFLNRLESVGMRITGPGTDLTVSAVEQSRWRGGVQTLHDGRSFIPYLPAERVSLLTDRQSTRGTVRASRPFSLLGQKVENASLTFFEGAVVDFDATAGKKQLAVALGIDDGASRLSEVSLVDCQTPLAAYERPFGYSGFDDNQVSSIVIGMGEASHLEALKTYEDEMELQRETGCNISLIRSRMPIGSAHLDVTVLLSDGSEKPIITNGSFII